MGHFWLQELEIIYKIPHCVPISAHHKWNFDDLLEKMWDYLKLMRIYTKPKGQLPDYSAPIVLPEDRNTIEFLCMKIHKNLLKDFKCAFLVWGSSVKHSPQKVGKEHRVNDEDVVQIIKKNLLSRLHLDGAEELYKSKSKFAKNFWKVYIVMFGISAWLSILTIRRYNLGKTIITAEENFKYRVGNQLPLITICRLERWNKTYMQETIKISDNIIEKAKLLNVTSKSQLLYEFSRYISYYSPTYSDDIDPKLWPLLTEMYEGNFGDMKFSEFVHDASFRSKEIFSL